MTELFLPVAVWVSGLLAITYAICPIHQSSYSPTQGITICCNYCKAGEEMENRCTTKDPKPTCQPCPEGFYNPERTNERCRTCNPCEESSIEEKPCTSFSDAKCRCPPGSAPKNDKQTACLCKKGHQIKENQCEACPEGHFSNEDNSKCRPWTNCSAIGEKQQEPGSSTEDVKCTRPNILRSTTLPSTTKSFIPRTTRAHYPKATEENIVSFTTANRTGSSISWKTLILVTSGLLSICFIIVPIMTVRMSQRKEKKKRHGSQSCRIPVQEESSSESSQIKIYTV